MAHASRPARVKVTDESCFIQHCRTASVWESAAAHFRRKPDKNEMDAAAERAATVWHLGQELMREAPITSDDVQKKFYDRYMEGDRTIETDIVAGNMFCLVFKLQ